MAKSERLEMRGIVKRFPGVVANDGVDFTARAGEIHALLGENGAGKTTLMRVLYGIYQPDAGEIFLDGRPIRVRSPAEALALGIGMVHQHFRLVPTLSVEENVVLGLREGLSPFPHLRRVRERLAAIARDYGLEVDPRAKVFELSVGEQQRVEILKALYRRVQILIMDEPTSVLTPQEVEQLFSTLRSLVEAGLTVIFITHKLDEVLAVSDRVTVLRKGKVVATLPTAEADKPSLARMMVGREVVFRLERGPAKRGERLLEVRDLQALSDRGLPAIRGLSFELYAGEILGVAGVAGNGQKELVEVLTGLRRATKGRVLLFGKDLTNRSPREIAAAGVAHIPEERLRRGLVPEMSVAENLVLKGYRDPPFARGPFLDQRAIIGHAEEAIAAYQIMTPSPNTPAKLLSGGNLQRLILARELSGQPRLIIAAHPTYGLDVGATEQIRGLLLKQRELGAGVLLISEDLEEILSLSDRILVLFAGQAMGLFKAGEAALEELGLLMAGARSGKGEEASAG
ncbi:MAG: ABC transporter ATP-binding protein [Candidatus Acetothermia bacterium]|jgi:simple sugar transport system ATP-binding protein|nr:ABC transporter ATP-binding protein [Candidatus Acetothermia bacterium]MDH7505083.1 ABC transporter ATP-binding protein [Candidatus Acetothermia bacterium]